MTMLEPIRWILRTFFGEMAKSVTDVAFWALAMWAVVCQVSAFATSQTNGIGASKKCVAIDSSKVAPWNSAFAFLVTWFPAIEACWLFLGIHAALCTVTLLLAIVANLLFRLLNFCDTLVVNSGESISIIFSTDSRGLGTLVSSISISCSAHRL